MKKTKVKAICRICSCETEVNKAVVTAKLPIYCSEKCKSQRYEHHCEICGKSFRSSKYDTRTCGRECQTLLRRKKVMEVQCFHCKKNFQRSTSDVYTGKRVFCSRRCRNNQHSLDNPSRYGTNWSTMRKKALKRDGYTCIWCSSDEDLEVHHIIKLRFFKNPNEANYLENLQTCCKECHKSIETKDIV